MKNLLKYIMFLVILILVFMFKEDIYHVISRLPIFSNNSDIIVNNNYSISKEYGYFKITDNFVPKNKTDIVNIYFTVINSGMESFTFYCDEKYSDCMNDVKIISTDQLLLGHMSNFISVFNNFKEIETIRYESSGKVTINITPLYSAKTIVEIDKKIDMILNNIITDDMDLEKKIKTIHDYIINNSKYDTLRSDEEIPTYASNTAYGPLFEGYGVCSGYTDAFKLFADKLGIENIKIATSDHVWNLLKINDEWKHIDLTSDDPITSTGEEIVDYDYFLISTDDLFKKDEVKFYFNEEIYAFILA